jgi:L-lactate dehydrogenase complex protein LldG
MPHHNSWLRSLPPPFSNWSHSRDFPPFAKKPFRERVRKMAVQGVARPDVEPPIETFPLPEAETIQDPVLAFRKNLEQVGGEFYQVSEAQAPNQVAELLRRLGIKQLLAWGELEPTIYSILHRLEWEGLKIQQPELPQGVGPERASTLAELDRFEAGLTGASAAIAESGTLVLPGGRRRSQLVSLLPPIHLAILHQRDIYTTMETWMKAGGERQVTNLAQTNLISGPSRTADIEMTLTVGVHGPRRVIVFCLE